MKKKIAVLFGGASPEHEVSLQSAYGVISNMDGERYEPVMLGITPNGEWLLFNGEAEKIRDNKWNNAEDCIRAVVSPCRGTHGVLTFDGDKTSTIRLDAAIPILHGRNGEDGTVQGLLELAGIPVAGCGTMSAALCMDKDRAHRMAASFGVLVPRSFTLKGGVDERGVRLCVKDLGYPLFVKPVKAGSSFGVTKVSSDKQLSDAIKLAFRYDDEIIVEEAIPGFEVGCAVMGNDELIVGEVDEIELAGGMFDFNEKYTLATAAIHVPARISRRKANEVKQTARTIYRALGCRGLARVDLFLQADGRIVLNEVNTLPGFTSYSRYPRMMAAAGIPLSEVIDRLLTLAMKG
jgi:D-alanine---D-serine ligase